MALIHSPTSSLMGFWTLGERMNYSLRSGH
jgi:hypothetical protein